MNELEKKKIEQDYLNFINSISVKQFENVQEYKNSIQKYRNNPVLFCEEFLGIKLFESQKQYLEILLKIKNGENKNEWNRYFKFI